MGEACLVVSVLDPALKVRFRLKMSFLLYGFLYSDVGENKSFFPGEDKFDQVCFKTTACWIRNYVCGLWGGIMARQNW